MCNITDGGHFTRGCRFVTASAIHSVSWGSGTPCSVATRCSSWRWARQTDAATETRTCSCRHCTQAPGHTRMLAMSGRTQHATGCDQQSRVTPHGGLGRAVRVSQHSSPQSPRSHRCHSIIFLGVHVSCFAYFFIYCDADADNTTSRYKHPMSPSPGTSHAHPTLRISRRSSQCHERFSWETRTFAYTTTTLINLPSTPLVGHIHHHRQIRLAAFPRQRPRQTMPLYLLRTLRRRRHRHLMMQDMLVHITLISTTSTTATTTAMTAIIVIIIIITTTTTPTSTMPRQHSLTRLLARLQWRVGGVVRHWVSSSPPRRVEV